VSTLPASVPSCPGQQSQHQPGAWPFPAQADSCSNCERRRQGVADYMAGAKVEWMVPPTGTPCPEQLRTKR
jgi:hypothetical protein